MGKLVGPSTEDHEELENDDRLMALDADEDLTIPHDATTADSLLEEVEIYPCPDFNIIPQQRASTIPLLTD